MIQGLTFGSLWPLLLLAIVPWLWWVRQKTSLDLGRRHLRVLTAVRSAIVVLLALAMTAPTIHRLGAWVSVIYALDVSQSVSPGMIQSAIQWIQDTNDSGRPAHSRYIAFGANDAVFDDLDRLRTVRVAEGAAENAIDQSATNVEGAIDAALENFAPHHLKRLVLMTDGNENAGRMAEALARLKALGVRVYTMPLQARSNGDVWMEAVLGPSSAAAEEPFPVEAHVYSQTSRSADVEIRSGDRSLARRTVPLSPGLNRVSFETSLAAAAGPVALEAEVKASGDGFHANDTFRSTVVVNGPPRILYIEGRPQSARYLQGALQKEGFAVTLIAPEHLPASVADLIPYDAIVVSDVERSRFSAQQMQAIEVYVRELGGGFILSGGENIFGADGGYSATPVETALPVTFHATKPHESVAMIVVLDKSGSMGGTELGFAKEAAKAPLRTLRDVDAFGVIAFDSGFYWAAPFQTAANRDEMMRMISTIAAGGETNAFPALQAAYQALAADKSEVKHVILMSDGHTVPADFERLVADMVQAGITVSTVALGAGSDNVLLGRIADWGKGRRYYLTDASRVPGVFTDEAERATGTTLREQPFSPIVKKDVRAFKGLDFSAAPLLRGYVATRSKDAAEVLLESARGDPILARWQYGLGRTAVFTSDMKDRWAVDWLRWNGYAKFWSQVVRDTMRSRDDSDFHFRVAREGDRAKISIDAIGRDGRYRNGLRPALKVVGPDQSASDVAIDQVGPGSYEATFRLTRQGGYTFHVVGEGTGLSQRLEYSYPAEYHFYPVNTGLLERMSAETNGRFKPEARDIFETTGETTALPMPLWKFLAAAALVLYLADVFLRRVRLPG